MSWHWSVAAVATVVSNIWACYLSSELEDTLPTPAACSLDCSSRQSAQNREKGRQREERRQRKSDSDEARVEETGWQHTKRKKCKSGWEGDRETEIVCM